MRILLWLTLAMTIAGCAAPLPPSQPAPTLPPVPNAPQPDDLRKLGPDLRRHLLQRSRQVLRQAQGKTLQSPEALSEQLRPIPVVIQAHSDITEDLKSHGARVRSVTRDGVVIITAEVPPAAILGLLALPELKSIELAQPVPPAEGGGGRKMEDGG